MKVSVQTTVLLCGLAISPPPLYTSRKMQNMKLINRLRAAQEALSSEERKARRAAADEYLKGCEPRFQELTRRMTGKP